jgi:DNA-binding CsgD family transcriptional regulator/tetratricopeptide (TPR) repeat protein
VQTIEPAEQLDGPLGSWPCVGRSVLVARALRAISGPLSAAVLLRGELGVGKTRIAEEAAARVSGDGMVVHRILATSATHNIPFGAVAHLLPAEVRTGHDPLAVIAGLRDVLAPVGSPRCVLLIDDAPLLDNSTAGFFASLLAASAVSVLATARIDETFPDALVGPLLGDRSLTIDVEPLSADDVDTLLHLSLGGPVDAVALNALRDRSAGNPLFLRELTRSAVDAGTLRFDEGLWCLKGELPRTARLRELVEARLDAVVVEARPVLDVLALCEPVELAELEHLVPLALLADLEERGMLRVSERAGRLLATLGHPLHGEAIRLSLPSLRARVVLRDHVAWMERSDHLSESERLQCALWRLDAGLPTDLDELLVGARLATAADDVVSAARLARQVFDREPSVESGMLLGNSLFHTGAFEEADAVFQQVAQLATDPKQRIAVALSRSNYFLWGLGSPDRALEALAEIADSLPDRERQHLATEEANVMVFSGHPGDALTHLEAVAAERQASGTFGAGAALSTALTLAGRTVEARRVATEALENRPGTDLPGLVSPETHLVTTGMALLEGGDVPGALDTAGRGYELAVSDQRPLTQFWFALLFGRIHLIQGTARTALAWFNRARGLAAGLGLEGPKRIAVAGAITASAMRGETALVKAGIAELDELPPFGFFAPEEQLARGWAAMALADPVAARETLQRGARHGIDTGHLTSAGWLLHDALRFGAGRDAADLLASLVPGTDSLLLAARADHGLALVSRNAPELARSVDQFELLGCRLLAAEAAVAAADAARSAGDQRGATALSGRASRLVQGCEGATTPALASAAAATQPLSEREREVALLAAGGLSSKEIAERLFLSARTVNNHLQHVYDKLGVRKRAELAQVLGVDAAEGGTP